MAKLRNRRLRGSPMNRALSAAFALALPLVSPMLKGCKEEKAGANCVQIQIDYTGDSRSCNALATIDMPLHDFRVHGSAIYYRSRDGLLYKADLNNTERSCVSGGLGSMGNISSGKIIFSPLAISREWWYENCEQEGVISAKLYDMQNDQIIDTGLNQLTCLTSPEMVVLKDNLVFYQTRSSAEYMVDIHVHDLDTGVSTTITRESPSILYGDMSANREAVLTYPVSESGIDIVYLDGTRINLGEGYCFGFLGDAHLAIRSTSESSTLIDLYSTNPLELVSSFELFEVQQPGFLIANNKLVFVNDGSGLTIYDPSTGETTVMEFNDLISDCGASVHDIFNQPSIRITPMIELFPAGENSAVYWVRTFLGFPMTVDGVKGTSVYKVIDF